MLISKPILLNILIAHPPPRIHPSCNDLEAGALGREAISKQVSFVLSHLEGVPNEVPSRCNCAILAHEELIAHYIEGEIREAIGEARGCLGRPTLRTKKVNV